MRIPRNIIVALSIAGSISGCEKKAKEKKPVDDKVDKGAQADIVKLAAVQEQVAGVAGKIDANAEQINRIQSKLKKVEGVSGEIKELQGKLDANGAELEKVNQAIADLKAFKAQQDEKERKRINALKYSPEAKKKRAQRLQARRDAKSFDNDSVVEAIRNMMEKAEAEYIETEEEEAVLRAAYNMFALAEAAAEKAAAEAEEIALFAAINRMFKQAEKDAEAYEDDQQRIGALEAVQAMFQRYEQEYKEYQGRKAAKKADPAGYNRKLQERENRKKPTKRALKAESRALEGVRRLFENK
jgi:hypothetical protein